MYPALLIAHSYLRWLVVVAGIWVLWRSIGGWRRRLPWQREDDWATLLFTAACDLQLLTGLLLYFAFSPMGFPGLDRMGSAMANPVSRFWAIEHPSMMILVVALAHLGRIRAKRVSDSELKLRRTVLFSLAAVAALLAATPWPFMPAGRPWYRPL